MKQRTRIYCSIFGASLGIISIILGMCFETIVFKQLEKILIIGTSSPLYEVWHKPPMDITADFYMFNWTNPQVFRNPDIKPKFEELGPYRFKSTSEKVDIVWHPENGSVSFRKNDFYFFTENGSRGSLDDILTSINPIAVAVTSLSQYMSSTKRMLAEMGMMVYPRDLTIKRTVDELLFKGYSDTLISFLNVLPISGGVNIPFDKFGYLYGRNNTPSFYGNFNMYTGAKNIDDLGILHTWNQQIHNELYPFECSKIGGSAGEFVGPYLKPEGTISLFVREFCRNILLGFHSVVQIDGVKGFKYVAGSEVIDNGTLHPENACLCNGDCLPSGVVNATSCWFNAPFFLSFPHFYQADPYYLNELDGLNPQKDKHEFIFIVDPKSSILLDLKARLQMNIFIRPIVKSRMFHDVRKIMFPLFWIDIHIHLSNELFDILRTAATVIFYGQIISGILAVSSFLLVIYCTLSNRRTSKESSDLTLKMDNEKEFYSYDIKRTSGSDLHKDEKNTEKNSSQPLLTK